MPRQRFLQRALARFAGAYALGRIERQYDDLAIANISGAGCVADGLRDTLGG
jgi:hypothetical protein